jgi:hypothetical protein
MLGVSYSLWASLARLVEQPPASQGAGPPPATPLEVLLRAAAAAPVLRHVLMPLLGSALMRMRPCGADSGALIERLVTTVPEVRAPGARGAALRRVHLRSRCARLAWRLQGRRRARHPPGAGLLLQGRQCCPRAIVRWGGRRRAGNACDSAGLASPRLPGDAGLRLLPWRRSGVCCWRRRGWCVP